MADPRLRTQGLVDPKIMDEIEAKVCDRLEDAFTVQSKAAQDIGLLKLSKVGARRNSALSSYARAQGVKCDGCNNRTRNQVRQTLSIFLNQ